MSWNEQEQVLHHLTERYGSTVFTEQHVYYKLVGFLKGSKRIFTVGNTWDEAMKRLARKAGQF